MPPEPAHDVALGRSAVGRQQLHRGVVRGLHQRLVQHHVGEAQQRAGGLCWRYWFDYVAEAEHATYINGAWHGNEVPYVFDTLGQVEPSRQYVNERDLAFAAQVADYWVSFARDAGARDSLAGPTRWPACRKGRDVLLRIGVNKHAGFRLENRFMRARMNLFKRVMKHHVSLD